MRGTRAKGYADGLLDIDRRSAEAVVRIAISHTAEFARDRWYDANDDIIGALAWVSTHGKGEQVRGGASWRASTTIGACISRRLSCAARAPRSPRLA